MANTRTLVIDSALETERPSPITGFIVAAFFALTPEAAAITVDLSLDPGHSQEASIARFQNGGGAALPTQYPFAIGLKIPVKINQQIYYDSGGGTTLCSVVIVEAP